MGCALVCGTSAELSAVPRYDQGEHDAEQRVVADRQHERLGKFGIRPVARRQNEMVADRIEPTRAPSAIGQHLRGEPFGEDLALAVRHDTPEPPHDEPQADAATCVRQVGR